jgi:hypothetical protein
MVATMIYGTVVNSELFCIKLTFLLHCFCVNLLKEVLDIMLYEVKLSQTLVKTGT